MQILRRPSHAFIKVAAKIVNPKVNKKVVAKNPGPGSLQQSPALLTEIGPAIKQFPGPSVA